MPSIRFRAAAAVVLSAAVLAGCASQPRSAAEVAEEEAVVIRSAEPQDYRFHMQQEGRSMSADEFDAWMKSRGIRIATGEPAAKKAKSSRRAND